MNFVIDFQKIDINEKEKYDEYLMHCNERGCEYSFANLNLWGRQRAAFVDGFLTLFSQFERHSVYPFPIGNGDVGPVLDAIIADARDRGIVCRITGLTPQDCVTLEERYPSQFRFHPDRDGCDYIYDIHALADLPGRKYQKKRNHVNKFRSLHPDCRIVPLTEDILPAVQEMTEQWYTDRLAQDDHDDYHLERAAMKRAFSHMDALGLEGLALVENGQILAMTMGSRLSEDTFDIHFEKAREDADGAYPAISQAFARYLREKYPELKFLDREDDMGLPGLRKAKLSYYPHHLVVKFWARLWEDVDED